MSNTTPVIRLLIVDDSALVREGLRAVLATHGAPHGIYLVGEAATRASAMAQVTSLQPDVVMLDVRLPDGSGLEVCSALKHLRPETKILILTSVASDDLIQEAFQAGAQGYLMKEIDPDGLMVAIRDAAGGKPVLTPDISERMLRLLRGGSVAREHDLSMLSAQERRIIALVAEGFTNKEIGANLKLSDNTVKNYLATVFEKLHIKRRSQAAAIFAKKTIANPKGN
jgi:two-component system, NarL family, response regulator DevR